MTSLNNVEIKDRKISAITLSVTALCTENKIYGICD